MAIENFEEIEKFVRDIALDINSQYPGSISDEYIEFMLDRVKKCDLNSDEIKELVKTEIARKTELHTKKELEEKEFKDKVSLLVASRPNSDATTFFGESLNYQMVELFQKYEQVQNLDFTDSAKALQFAGLKENLIHQIANSGFPFAYGINDLDYETVRNLYDNFINSQDIVVDEWGSKMNVTIKRDVPLFDEYGTVRRDAYDFGKSKKVFDFARSHNKEFKFHTILWHKAFPEILKSSLEGKSKEEKRSLTLKFIEDYVSYIREWSSRYGYEFRQIDALNEIINPDLEGGIYRESEWEKAIGKNPDNGDLYFIDVLKIIRKNFPNTELIYNDYDEYLPYKADRIYDMLEYVKSIERRDGVKLIDGIGLQSHYCDWSASLEREVTSSDIYYSMAKLCETRLPMYRTEYDFTVCTDNPDVQRDVKSAIRICDEYCGIGGVIAWNNNDTTSWKYSERTKTPHIVDSEGKPKEEYGYYCKKYSKTKPPEVKEDVSVLKKVKDGDEPPNGYVLSNSLIVLVVLLVATLIIGICMLIN